MNNGQVQPEQPQQAPPPLPAMMQDHLVKMFVEDLPRDIERLRRINPSDTKRLRDELVGTVMSYIRDTVSFLIRVRNWSGEGMQSLDARILALEEQRDSAGAGESGIDAEEHDKMLQLCGGTRALVEMIVQMAASLRKGEKVDVTMDQQKVVEEQGALADECLQFLSAYEVDAAEGEEPEEDEEEDGGG